jgi:hypothetical protein
MSTIWMDTYKFNLSPDLSIFFQCTKNCTVLLRVAEGCLSQALVKTRIRFQRTMVASGYGTLPSPVAWRHPNQVHRHHPHTMGNAACTWFGINPPGGQVVSTTTTNVNVSFCLSIRALLMVHLICLVACDIPSAIVHLLPSNERERQ